MYMYWFALDRTDARLAAAKNAADKALALQPDLGEAHYAVALYHYWGHREYAPALAEIALARKTWPNSSEIEQIDAAILRRQGNFERAIEGFHRAGEFDPRNSSPPFDEALSNVHLRRYAVAEPLFVRSASLSSSPASQLGSRGECVALRSGDMAALRGAVDALVPGSSEYETSSRFVFEVAWWSRDFAAAARITESDSTKPWYESNNIAVPLRVWAGFVHAIAGDPARAREISAEIEADVTARSRARPNDADLHLALGMILAQLGRAAEAGAEARRAMELLPVTRDAVTGPGVMGFAARIYTLTGAHREAIDLLRRLLAMPAGYVVSPASLQFDPSWDPLRGDPEFRALLKSDGADKDATNG
jgi:serine/threonine-protein kinase